MVSGVDVERVALLIQYVRVDAKSLQQLLPFLVAALPLVHTKRTFADNQPIQHLLVILCDADGILFLGLRVQAADLSWR